MKTLIQYGLAGLLSIGMSGTSFAYTIGTDPNTIDVGDLDGFLAGENLPNSGTGTESDWVNSILGTDYVFDIRTEDLTATVTNEDTGVIAVELPDANEDLYFVIKNATYTALFHNDDDLGWAVLDTSQEITVIDKKGDKQVGLFSDFFNLSTDRMAVSHISMVPEPSTVALMGLGLLGLGFARRRRPA